MTEDQFVVAARGWRHEGWQSCFYPEDLPEDWRLSYYSNEFRAVVVPAEYWPGVDEAEVERWVEDTGEAFQFFLEVTDLRCGWPEFAALVAPLGDQLGGVLLRPTHCDVDLSQLSLSLQRARELGPVSVILPAGLQPSERGQALLADAGLNPCWDVARASQPDWSPADLSLALASGVARTPREWRGVVENCLSFGVDSDTVLLMMEGDPPDVEALRVTMVIADMLSAAEVVR